MSDIINSASDMSPLNKKLMAVGLTNPFRAKVYPTPIPSAKIQLSVPYNGTLGFNTTIKIVVSESKFIW